MSNTVSNWWRQNWNADGMITEGLNMIYSTSLECIIVLVSFLKNHSLFLKNWN